MDAYMMRTAGGAPAARGEDASQEQDPVEQHGTDGDMDGDEEPSGVTGVAFGIAFGLRHTISVRRLWVDFGSRG